LQDIDGSYPEKIEIFGKFVHRSRQNFPEVAGNSLLRPISVRPQSHPFRKPNLTAISYARTIKSANWDRRKSGFCDNSIRKIRAKWQPNSQHCPPSLLEIQADHQVLQADFLPVQSILPVQFRDLL